MNAFIATGRIVGNPEVSTKGDKTLCSFGFRVQREHPPVNGPAYDDFNCLARQGPAKYAAKHLFVGADVAIHGRIEGGNVMVDRIEVQASAAPPAREESCSRG